MKLRNKKTGKIINSKELLTDKFLIDLFSKDFNYFISQLDKIQKEWEEYKPKDTLKYYLINEYSGYIATFDSKEEMNMFMCEIDGWRQVTIKKKY